MKSYLIIPMGGEGKRFINAGYTTYKSFIKIEKKKTVLDEIVNNFEGFNSKVIILLNFLSFNKNYLNYLRKKNFYLINISKHTKGPLYSIYLAKKKIKEIIRENQNIFISYCDINWTWNKKKILKEIKKYNNVVFTHKGFHPHLNVNSKSDFCASKNNKILDISEKKTFSKNYEDDFLAIGCYFIKEFKEIDNFFEKKQLKNKKEFYLTTFIKHLIKKKMTIGNILISNFVHLGTPDQYEDYIKWRNHNNKNNFLQKKNNKSKSVVMLMGGKGKRVADLNCPKPFLKIKNRPIFNLIFQNLNAKQKVVITNSNFKNKLNKNIYKIFYVKKTKSMFETIFESKKILKNRTNYFLTSCDCIGEVENKKLKTFCNNNKIDLVFFAFKHSYFQRSLVNAHTKLITKHNVVKDIKVKNSENNHYYGHAGYFWIKSKKVFNFLEIYKKSREYKKLSREILIDDYFKFLVKKKLVSNTYCLLNDYIHVGSTNEYKEYIYWENYFHEKKIN
jgi:molybdopterin-guanine dinucleotide biosynthesis protein A